MKIIYRVQDKDGRGPFKPGFSHNWIDVDKDVTKLLPSFIDFPLTLSAIKLGYYDGYCGTGCKNLEQLKKWFSENELKKLKELGYSIVSVKVHKILAESDIQLLFQCKKPIKKCVLKIILDN